MKKILGCVLACLFCFQVQSAHIVGGYFEYSVIGINQNGDYDIEVELFLYREAFGGGADFDQIVDIGIYRGSQDTWVHQQSLDIPLTERKSIIEQITSEFELLPESLDFEEGRYKFVVSLAADLNINEHYQIVYQRCCRTQNLSNIINPEETGFAIHIELSNEALVNQNDGFHFGSLPVFRSALGAEIDYSLNPSDAESNDMLMYLCAPKMAGGTIGANGGGDPFDCDGVMPSSAFCLPPFDEVQYLIPSFNPGQPLGISSDFNIDNSGNYSGQGQINGLFTYGICILESEGSTFYSRQNIDASILISDTYLVARVQSTVFFDLNENGFRDAGEPDFYDYGLESLPAAFVEGEQENGHAELFITELGTYDLLFDFGTEWEMTTPDLSVEIDELAQYYNVEVGVRPNEITTEATAHFTPYSIRCDAFTKQGIRLKNNGSTFVSGSLVYFPDDSVEVLEYVEIPDVITIDSVVWYFEDLAPSHQMEYCGFIQMPSESFVGEVMNFTTKVYYESSVESQVFCKNNPFVLSCSYDPNDKQVFPRRENGEMFRGEILDYTIRFQNTGNAPAYYVRIEDELHENLNWSTIRFIDASHPVEIKEWNDGLLSFTFDDIVLPDSLSDPIGSQGFVRFEINVKDDLNNFDIVENTGYIFFDSNSPIITNTTVNQIFDPSSIHDDFLLNANVFPNPAKNEVIVQGIEEKENYSYEILDVNGAKLQKGNLMNNGVINLQEIPSGMLFLRIIDIDTNYRQKVLKLFHVE